MERIEPYWTQTDLLLGLTLRLVLLRGLAMGLVGAQLPSVTAEVPGLLQEQARVPTRLQGVVQGLLVE